MTMAAITFVFFRVEPVHGLLERVREFLACVLDLGGKVRIGCLATGHHVVRGACAPG